MKIVNAEQATDELKQRHQTAETALDAQGRQAERSLQELNANTGRFNVCHRTVEQYVHPLGLFPQV